MGESQAKKETVESTLCRYPVLQCRLSDPESCNTAKCERGERGGEGGTALSLRVQVEKA